MKYIMQIMMAGIVFGVTLLFQSGKVAAAEAGKQEPGNLERNMKITMKYLLYLPRDYEKNESWPLMLFLHGSGERGEDLEKVKLHGPPHLVQEGREFPFIVVSPQCPNGRWWEPVELAALLDEMVEKYKVDKDRIFVTGLSMGGFGTWSMAAYQPDRFAAIVPICGGGEPFTAKLFSKVPVWVFHGAKDTAVPLERSEKMVEALKKSGSTNVQFTVYPDGGHADAWTRAYTDPKLYEWLLQQKRK